VGARALGCRPWGASAHFLQSFKNVFKAEISTKMCLKMRILGEITVKFFSASGLRPSNPCLPSTAGGSAPRPPRCYSRLLLQTLYSSILTHHAFYCSLKEEIITIVNVLLLLLSHFLHLFFTLNSVVCVEGGARIFLAPGRRVP